MKTKHLLTALALPAIFAACTADDIVTEGANQTQRVALNENFKLNFGNVESRLSAGKPGEAFAYTFEEGDLVGGAVIDSYTGAKEPTTGTEFEKIDAVYSTQYFVSANQPFKFDGSAWTLEHTMVEGKYLFYYPYNTENNSRGAAKYSIPVMQDLSDKVTGEFNPKAAIEKYAMAVGYQFLDDKDLSASVELAPIFSYARIVMTLDNQFAGGEIDKIVLESKGNDFKLNGQLNNKKIENIFRLQAADKDFDWDDYSATAKFELENKNDDMNSKTFYNEEFNKGSKVIVGKVPAGTKMTKDAQNNHSFETYMVVPAQVMTGDIYAYLYTTDGKIYSNKVEYKAPLTFNRNTPKKLTVNLDTNNGEVPYVIASQEDWNTSVSMMAKDETANFIIADSEFTITNETLFPKTGSITVDKVTVSGNNVTMKNVVATEVTVSEGAKLNADVTTTIATIINEGEVVVVANPEAESRAVELEEYHITAIENHATLTINKDAVITLDLTNEQGAVVNNAGTLNVEGSNEGTINNTGAINFVDDFTNESREYELVGEEYEVVNEPKIDNAATGEIRATIGDLTNKSLIVNAGILSCGNNEGLIKNNKDSRNEAAVIDAKANSITLISSSENGKVIVYALKQANMSINDGKGTVEYTANANINIDESNVTDVIATATITITQGSDATKNGKLKNLKVAADATITVVAPATNAKTFTSIEVAEGKKLTLGSSLETASLTIGEKASVIVPKNMTLKVTGETFGNEGTVVVTGALVAESVLKENGGTVLDNGGTGSISWKLEGEALTLKTKKEAYETAMKAAVKAFAEDNTDQGVAFFNYNLNDSLTHWTATAATATAAQRGAANWFEHTRNNGALKTAYDAYVAQYKVVNGADATAPEFLSYYSDAVKAYTDAVKTTAAYAEDLANDWTITVPQDGTQDNFFKATKRTSVLYTSTKENVTVSAKTNALIRFKEYVVTDNTLDMATQVVLCSEGSYDNISAYVPVGTFAFEADNVYTYYKDYVVKYNLSGYNKTTLELLQKDIKWLGDLTAEKVEGLTSVGEKKLHAFVVANDYTVYDEAMEWNYTDATIAAIASAAAGN